MPSNYCERSSQCTATMNTSIFTRMSISTPMPMNTPTEKRNTRTSTHTPILTSTATNTNMSMTIETLGFTIMITLATMVLTTTSIPHMKKRSTITAID